MNAAYIVLLWVAVGYSAGWLLGYYTRGNERK